MSLSTAVDARQRESDRQLLRLVLPVITLFEYVCRVGQVSRLNPDSEETRDLIRREFDTTIASVGLELPKDDYNKILGLLAGAYKETFAGQWTDSKMNKRIHESLKILLAYTL